MPPSSSSPASGFAYDLCVIGGGSGGVRAARQAAATGARVVLIEQERLGGTCVNVGCIPKKFLVYASHLADEFELAQSYGWQFSGKRSFAWAKLRDAIASELGRLNSVYDKLLREAGVELRRGHGRVVGPQAVAVGGETIACRTILLATGSAPYVPPLPGAELALTSQDMFTLPALPESLLIVGGGYIALEFASIMQGLGVATTVVHRGSQVATGFDGGVREFLRDEMAKKGVQFILGTSVQALKKAPQGSLLQAELSNGECRQAAAVLMATGRRPLTKGLGIDAEDGSGVVLARDEAGHLKVNAAYQSSCPSVYALGDLIATPALTPVATAEAMVFVDQVFRQGKRSALHFDKLATAVFSQPPVGTIGLTEEKARERFDDIYTYETSFRPLKHALGEGSSERCFMKLVVRGEHGEVIGAHMVGGDAPEIVQGFAVAMQAGATKADFDRTIGIHPTSAEEFVTMRSPAQRPHPR